MWIPGFKTARQGVRWLHGRLVPHAVVLGYHRIGDRVRDPFGLDVSPTHFEQQVESLREMASPVPLRGLLHAHADGRLPPHAVAVTFDDGYADLRTHALPVLRRFQVPVTVFVTSGLLGRPYWWDRLERAVGSGGDARQLGGRSDSLYQRMREMDPETREAMLLEMERESGSVDEIAGCLTSSDLAELARDPLVEIGSHTRTHPWLPSLPAERVMDEVGESRRELEQITGVPVEGFSFPFGGTTPALRAVVRTVGYRYACDSRAAVLTAGTDSFAIPRFWVPNQDGSRFSRWLRRWVRG